MCKVCSNVQQRNQKNSEDRSLLAAAGPFATVIYQHDIAIDSTMVTILMEILPTFEKTTPTFDNWSVEKRGREPR